MKTETREQVIPRLINKHNYKVGVEIGVDLGYFSDIILKNTNLEILYSVDPWVDQNNNFVKDRFINASNLLSVHGNRSQIIIDTSYEASQLIDNNSIDFIYVDGNHKYDYVLQDIIIWEKKLKKGGMLCGHDYKNIGRGVSKHYLGNKESGKCEVKRAVDDYCEEHNIKLNIILDHPKSWYFIKE